MKLKSALLGVATLLAGVSTAAAVENGIVSVKKNAPDAQVADST